MISYLPPSFPPHKNYNPVYIKVSRKNQTIANIMFSDESKKMKKKCKVEAGTLRDFVFASGFAFFMLLLRVYSR